jgi:maltooligosyltrehalose trehalohydrolase
LSQPGPDAWPLGASKVDVGTWSFLVWAPRCDAVSVQVSDDAGEQIHSLSALARGYHGAVISGIGDASTYRFVLPDGTALPDPASRWQPAGVHGASRIVDPTQFAWTDAAFRPRPLRETVLYELHVGTFSAAGTFDGAIEHLDDLVDLGVTAVEPMPVAAFPGERNWGYDGVFPFAVQHSYGGPAGLQRFVNACHDRGLAVFLDVVYNHLGPEGNVLDRYAPYFTEVYSTPWGAAMNFSEAGSDEVRRYFIDNALMWLRDYHVDGLRLDAVHGIVDPTASPFLREVTAAVSALSEELGRPMHLIAESADNNPQVVSSRETGGLGFDAQWNDDFHHALHAVLTGERDGYYVDFGRLDQLARAINDGFTFQGEHSVFRGRRHGADSRATPPDRFVVFSQNHDQIGNRAGAQRLVSLLGQDKARLAAAIVLLCPSVPLLFMGEEYAEAAPFPYFVDHSDPDLLAAVRRGRAEEFARDADEFDPGAATTFAQARLNRVQMSTPEGAAMRSAYRDLLAVRRDYPVITDPAPLESTAAVIGDVLTLHRRTVRQSSFAAFNIAGKSATVVLPGAVAAWRLVLGQKPAGGAGVLEPHGYALWVNEEADS